MISKFKEHWQKASKKEKILEIFSYLVAILVIILSVLGFFDIIPTELANLINFPLLAILFILIRNRQYKEIKVISYLMYGTSAFLLIMYILILYKKIFIYNNLF